jgi:RimJ/RimL family protein N-acetyltransferase
MTPRAVTLNDVPLLAASYAVALSLRSKEAAEHQLRQLLDPQVPEGQGVLVESAPGAILGVALSGLDPDRYSGAALHMLSVPPNGDGRRLAGPLIQALGASLRSHQVRQLWIRSDPQHLPTFVRLGAVDLGHAPPARGSRQARHLLRLFTASRPDMLQTRRLILRPWESTDLKPFRKLNEDPDVCHWLAGTLSGEESDALADQIVEDLSRYGFGYWAIEIQASTLRPDERFMGFVGLGPLTRLAPVQAHLEGPGLELAWRLFPQFQNQGYATEAAQAAIEYAFNELHAREVVAATVPENRASERVMQKLGMRRDLLGDFEHPALPKGHPLRSHILYRLSKSR